MLSLCFWWGSQIFSSSGGSKLHGEGAISKIPGDLDPRTQGKYTPGALWV